MVNSCNNPNYGNGYCRRHYDQVRRHGVILKRTRFDKNEIIKYEKYASIILYSGRNGQTMTAKTKIDLKDIENIKDYKWRLGGRGYVVSGDTILHRLLLKDIDIESMDIDHINHDKLDNRRKNLRVCTRSQNNMNRKNVLGVSLVKETKKWEAHIGINNNKIHLGYFKDKKEALLAREKAELKYFKEYKYNGK